MKRLEAAEINWPAAPFDIIIPIAGLIGSCYAIESKYERKEKPDKSFQSS